jgi:2,3-bisphosphoglycerate-independent phosphoglycerate mutase
MNLAGPPSRPRPRRRQRPAVLCILDGWGWRPEISDNAILAAKTPNFDRMMRECPHALLATSGREVGLPDGQMGNSEVGHTNIGAGRLVMQDLPRIDDAVERVTLADRPELRVLIARAKAAGGAVHLLGLVSPGGVHSHQTHITALAGILDAAGLEVRIHAFLDGRDTPPQSALGFVADFERSIATLARARIATVSGRYYAMDRDKRWDRVAKAYATLVDAEGARFPDAGSAIANSYETGVTDEFVLPCVIGSYAGMRDQDALLFANFRPDRAREISTALLDPTFDGFVRARVPLFSAAAGMTAYSEALQNFMTALFPPEEITGTLGELFAERGLKQLRIAETEKYPHVTFFMNGGRETQFPGEDRILIPSPKVATYDMKPDMSAREVTDKLIEAVGSGKYDLIIVNYANPDMVGHTGVMKAAIQAVETIDECLGRLRAAVESAGGVLLLTADHGNVELMRDQTTGEPHTAHTLLDVPIIAVNAGGDLRLQNGRLADVTPTLLDLLGMAKPPQMTGRSLAEPEYGMQKTEIGP